MQHNFHHANPKLAPLAMRQFWSIWVLLIIPLSGLSVDIYVPSLPAISRYFSVDQSYVQMTITFFMLGFGFMQLFAGAISDSFGRRKPFLIAMFFFIVATLLIPFCSNISQLLILRLLQGILLAAISVPMRAVIADLFQGSEYHTMSNYMVMAWSIGPIVAPAIGGYLQHYFGWQANFYFLALYSLLGYLLIIYYLPETAQQFHPFKLRPMFQRYTKMLGNREYMQRVIINGLIYSMMILFAALGPFILQTVLGFSAIQFGYVALLMGLGWFLGNVTSRLLLRVPRRLKSKICLFILCGLSMGMWALAAVFPLNAYAVIIPVFLILFVGGVVFPDNVAEANALFVESPASANALVGSLIFLLTTLNGAVSGLLKSHTAFPLASAYVVETIVCLMIFYFCRNLPK